MAMAFLFFCIYPLDYGLFNGCVGVHCMVMDIDMFIKQEVNLYIRREENPA
jgi:hypothetical protein